MWWGQALHLEQGWVGPETLGLEAGPGLTELSGAVWTGLVVPELGKLTNTGPHRDSQLALVPAHPRPSFSPSHLRVAPSPFPQGSSFSSA